MTRVRRSLTALLLGWQVALVAAASGAAEPGPRPAAPQPASRVLPGVRPDGFVQLPNQWRLKPAGTQLDVGDFPVQIAVHPTGRWLALLHAGYGTHEVIIVEARVYPKIVSRVTIDQAFYGLCFAPDGKALFASGGASAVVHRFDFADGLLSSPHKLAIAPPTDTFITGGLATDARGAMLYVCGTWGDAVVRMPLDNPAKQVRIPLGPPKPDPQQQPYPYGCLVEPNGKRLFVSLWNRAAVAVIDLGSNQVTAEWPTARHPTEMALSPDGKHLFAACANSTMVSVLETASGRARQTIACCLYPGAPSGNTPNSLSLTPDGQMLFVANADANNVAVFNVTDPANAKPLGFIPVGWYPTSVRFNPTGKKLYVANGKGLHSKANRNGPQPNLPVTLTTAEYIANLFHGTLSVIDLPTPQKMADYSRQAYACSPLQRDAGVVGTALPDNPVPRKLGEQGPIKHVIYIVKENRTYDQVFGDVKEGNGDASLCLFGEAVTPNHHKLARDFVLLDNLYADGEVSADGHEWSMGAYATDYVEKVWPLVYRGGARRKLTYPAEGATDAVARPAGGYLWDRCAEAGVSYRSYGEWIENGKTPDQPGKARVKTLEGHFDPLFRGFDTDYTDQKRVDRFLVELRRFERDGGFPNFIVLRLPNDHTAGTRVGRLTPTAMVADNDLALGRLVEAVSKSRFWKQTAIFVIEDDAQNGPDHVDAHRTVGLVVSPYTRRGHVDSTMYSTTSMLRTMELILGLKPMSQFDAAATPMFASFQARPDYRPYVHVVPKVDLNAENGANAWGAKLSETFELAKEDQADDLLFNEVIWRSVRGANQPMPAPVRAAFVRPNH